MNETMALFHAGPTGRRALNRQAPRVSPWAIFMLSPWESRDGGLGWAEIPLLTMKTKRNIVVILTTKVSFMPTVEKLSIALPTEMAAIVRRAVQAGEYSSNSEVIRDALRDWTHKRNLREQSLAGLCGSRRRRLRRPRPSPQSGKKTARKPTKLPT